jgi:hypothetical protein
MNRALWKPALLFVIILTLATASGFLLRGNTTSAKPPDAFQADEQGPEPAETPKTVESAKAANPATAGESPKVAPVPTVAEDPKTATERRQLLETVGALTAAHCCQAYFNIGLVADGRAKGIYTDKDSSKLLGSILGLLNTVDRKLALLVRIDLDKQDRESLKQMRALSALLHQQGKELETFWDSGKDEDAAKYESARKDSWAALGKLTGIGR